MLFWKEDFEKSCSRDAHWTELFTLRREAWAKLFVRLSRRRSMFILRLRFLLFIFSWMFASFSSYCCRAIQENRLTVSRMKPPSCIYKRMTLSSLEAATLLQFDEQVPTTCPKPQWCVTTSVRLHSFLIGSISLGTLILICYKENLTKKRNRWQLSRVNIDHRLDSCSTPRDRCFCVSYEAIP